MRLVKTEREWAWVLAGWVISRCGFSLVRGYHWHGFVVQPGFIIALWMVFHFSRKFMRRAQPGIPAFISMGILLDSLAYWILRGAAESGSSRFSPWDGGVLRLSVAFLLAWAAVYALLQLIPPRPPHSPAQYPAARERSRILTPAVLLTIAVFRVTYLLTRGIPNEGRSLFIGGMEIHHAVLGVISLVVFVTLFSRALIRRNRITAWIYGFIIGAVIDQTGYLQLTPLTDRAYNSAASYMGALLPAAALIIWLYCDKSPAFPPEPDN